MIADRALQGIAMGATPFGVGPMRYALPRQAKARAPRVERFESRGSAVTERQTLRG
ncbi:hypothetical protein GCM10010307_51640 [Streptomyces vastus]|uniref:Aldo/keto reductase n=1 Tax=Streptomyces vastus TaxID=285451 RepID=A0ABN3R862_9ACTN